MTPAPTTETKHTPGPWSMVARDTTFDIIGSDGVRVLSTSWHNSIRKTYPLKDEARRNAIVATAAPDLLEIAKRIEAAMDFDASDHPMFEGMQAQLTAAIAKAEGRQS